MNSALNPEAPEFHPLLLSTVQDGYQKMQKTIRTSNNFPVGNSHELFKTFTEFNAITYKLSENIVLQSNQILSNELPAAKLKCADFEGNMEKIIDANDCLLDKININIDTVTGEYRPNENLVVNKMGVASWNQTPIIARIKVGSATFIGAKNIPRPQMGFKDTIDNSHNIWIPKIFDKPNNIKPLALTILYKDDGNPVGYEHPYKLELSLYTPPPDMLVDTDENPLPPPLDQTPFTFVNTKPQLDLLVEHLTQVREIAVDLEHHSYRSYQGFTCLIQITTEGGGDFIIDTLAIREHIHLLNFAFTDPKKIKVFHGADNDILWLQRDFGVYVVGLFDTHQAARKLRLPALSLKHLLHRYCNFDADKKYQLADWRIRPLPEELVAYARSDTHYLLYIWRQMRRELLQLDDAAESLALLTVFDASRNICTVTYNKEVIDDESHLPLYNRSRKHFNSQQMAAFKMLFRWRDSFARELDESTMYLLPNHMLLALAENLPREVQGINACCSPMPPFIKQHLGVLHQMILSCREMPAEPQLYEVPPAIRSIINAAPQYDRRPHDKQKYLEGNEEELVSINTAYWLFEYGQVATDMRPMSAVPFTAVTPTLAVKSGSNLQDFKDLAVTPVSTPFENSDVLSIVEPQEMENLAQRPTHMVSNLNVEAKLFIPPYHRYTRYRLLAQAEELKEYKEKEAKIAAISKGNELIKVEVLQKVQQAQETIEKTVTEPSTSASAIAAKDFFNVHENKSNDKNKAAKRKRKIIEKCEHKDPTEETIDINKKDKQNNANINSGDEMKPHVYMNVNYKKFFSESKKGGKQSKK